MHKYQRTVSSLLMKIAEKYYRIWIGPNRHGNIIYVFLPGFNSLRPRHA